MPVRPSLKQLFGAIGLLVFVVAYMLFAMVFGTMALINAPGWVQFFGFAFLGLIWVIPAGIIVRWMVRQSH